MAIDVYVENAEDAGASDRAVRSFGAFRVADTADGRIAAGRLVNKMYALRGYAVTHPSGANPNRRTLTASANGEVVGTVTVGIDCPIGLVTDQVFQEELDVYRHRGARVCEFTKLAFDPAVRSNTAIGGLFHLAVIYARDIRRCTELFIEVHPRHLRFYQTMLGFERLGELKTNPNVKAPSCLLHASLDYITEQIRKHGGTSDRVSSERSFYRYFFSPQEEPGLIERLLRSDEETATAA